MIGDPEITFREQRLTMGIRTIAPFRGMFAVRDALLKELRLWVTAHEISEEGPYFLRYHVIDMNNQMDIEVGYVVSTHLAGDERVAPRVLPALRRTSHSTEKPYLALSHHSSPSKRG